MNTDESRAEAARVNGGTELHLAARLGDVARAAYLLEVCGASVNAYDQWEATPLFYASLCGHTGVLRLLLQAGARCERHTFDGERVLYAALNDTVRNVLLSEGFAFAASRGHDAYLDHLENAFDEQQSAHARYRDLLLTVSSAGDGDGDGGDADPAVLEAHTCILAARCPYLARRFRGRRHVHLRPLFPASALAPLLRWCYTARLDVRRDDLPHTLKLLAQCGLHEQAAKLRTEELKQPRQQQRLVVEPPSAADAKAELTAAMKQLYDVCCDDLDDGDRASGDDDGNLRELLRAGAARFLVDGRMFHVHPAFLAPRSEFFDAFCSGRWRNGQDDEEPLHDVSHTAFACLLRWAFTDALDEDTQRSPERLVELIHLADRFLMDGLKQRAATVLIPHVNAHTCVPLLRLAERCGADRLGEAAAAVVAEHLLDLADDDELEAAVRESASLIQGRQQTDSIPVVDDIAFHVSRLHGEGAADGLSDEDEEDRWTMPSDADARTREALTAAMRAQARSCRRRKVAVLTQLAARVQGWDVVAVRTRT